MQRPHLSTFSLASSPLGLTRPVRVRCVTLASPPLCRDIKPPSPFSRILHSLPPLCHLVCRLLGPFISLHPSSSLPTIADRPASILPEAFSRIALARIGSPPSPPLSPCPGLMTRAFDSTAPSHSLPFASTTLLPLSSNEDGAILRRAEGLGALDSAALHPRTSASLRRPPVSPLS